MRVGEERAKVAAVALGIGLSFPGFSQEPLAGERMGSSPPAYSHPLDSRPPQVDKSSSSLAELQTPAVPALYAGPESPRPDSTRPQDAQEPTPEADSQSPADGEKTFSEEDFSRAVEQKEREMSLKYRRDVDRIISEVCAIAGFLIAGSWLCIRAIGTVTFLIRRKLLKESAETLMSQGLLKKLEFPLRPRFSPSAGAIQAAGALMHHIERAREELYKLGVETDSTSATHIDPKERGVVNRLMAHYRNAVRQADRPASEWIKNVPDNKKRLYFVLDAFLAGTSSLLRRSGIAPRDAESPEVGAVPRRRISNQARANKGASESNTERQRQRDALSSGLRDEIRVSVEQEILDKFAQENQRLDQERTQNEKIRKELNNLRAEIAEQKRQLDHQQRELELNHDRLGQRIAQNQRIEQHTIQEKEEILRQKNEQEAAIVRLEALEKSLQELGAEALLNDPEKALEIIHKLAAQELDD